MNALTAIGELHQDLELLGQSKERSTEVVQKLNETIGAGLGFLPDNGLRKCLVYLYPCEILAVQRFLTQFGFHLKAIQPNYDKIETRLACGVFPNWK